MNLFAEMWRDQEKTGFDEAIYWLELLIKYRSFEHLKINDNELNLLQYFSVDVVCAFILFLAILSFILWKCVRLIISRVSFQLSPRVRRNSKLTGNFK